MLKETRQQTIRDLVDEHGQITVAELDELLSVSSATIRRDLDELGERGWIARSHGGAVRVNGARKEPPLAARRGQMAAEKKRIAQRAAALTHDGDTVFLGSGTTVAAIAPYLASIRGLTIVTNSLAVVGELRGSGAPEVILTGGTLRPSEDSMVGPIAQQTIRLFRPDRIFVGMRAIDVRHGFTGDTVEEAATDRSIFDIACNVTVLADSSKFGRVSTIVIADISAASLIITDNGLDLSMQEQVLETDVALEVV
jgi:DeoR/GlpR family transcriptional regulator of sugar metabolism